MVLLSDNAAICLDASVTLEASGIIRTSLSEAVSSSTCLPSQLHDEAHLSTRIKDVLMPATDITIIVTKTVYS